MLGQKGSLVLLIWLCALASCGGSGVVNNRLEGLQPYTTSGPYADRLVRCAVAKDSAESCTLTELPLLTNTSQIPSVDEIMSRVVVSHPWMAMRFKALLGELPNDLRQMFGAVTVIVIHGDIRPSFYWKTTGAIYLDPFNLWLTQTEKNTISVAPDFRGEYAKTLNFKSVWRQTKRGAEAYDYFGLGYPGERDLEQIVIPMAALLFHELAHANDSAPPTYRQFAAQDKKIGKALSGLYSHYPSTLMRQQYPLLSEQMMHIGSILFHGLPATEADKQLEAAEVGFYFEQDQANDDYAYTSQYEDLAMLIEEAMMKIHYQIDREVAYLTVPDSLTHCDDEKIGWGMRNRIASPGVKARAAQAVAAVLPNRDYSAFFATLPPPEYLQVDIGWCASMAAAEAEYNPLGYGASSQYRIRPDHISRPYAVQD